MRYAMTLADGMDVHAGGERKPSGHYWPREVGSATLTGSSGSTRQLRRMRGSAQRSVQLLVDSGHLSEQEAARFHRRNMLVNVLGGSSGNVEVDVDQAERCNADRILMCSDGLTDMIDDVAIRRVLVESPDSQQACQRLLELALDRGGKDNVTVIVATYTL